MKEHAHNDTMAEIVPASPTTLPAQSATLPLQSALMVPISAVDEEQRAALRLGNETSPDRNEHSETPAFSPPAASPLLHMTAPQFAVEDESDEVESLGKVSCTESIVEMYPTPPLMLLAEQLATPLMWHLVSLAETLGRLQLTTAVLEVHKKAADEAVIDSAEEAEDDAGEIAADEDEPEPWPSALDQLIVCATAPGSSYDFAKTPDVVNPAITALRFDTKYALEVSLQTCDAVMAAFSYLKINAQLCADRNIAVDGDVFLGALYAAHEIAYLAKVLELKHPYMEPEEIDSYTANLDDANNVLASTISNVRELLLGVHEAIPSLGESPSVSAFKIFLTIGKLGKEIWGEKNEILEIFENLCIGYRPQTNATSIESNSEVASPSAVDDEGDSPDVPGSGAAADTQDSGSSDVAMNNNLASNLASAFASTAPEANTAQSSASYHDEGASSDGSHWDLRYLEAEIEAARYRGNKNLYDMFKEVKEAIERGLRPQRQDFKIEFKTKTESHHNKERSGDFSNADLFPSSFMDLIFASSSSSDAAEVEPRQPEHSNGCDSDVLAALVGESGPSFIQAASNAMSGQGVACLA